MRRSKISAAAPAGSASRKTGSIEAACTRLTITGEGSSEVIIHPAPVFWTQSPILAARFAHHSRRKAGWRRGAKAAGITSRVAEAARQREEFLAPRGAAPLRTGAALQSSVVAGPVGRAAWFHSVRIFSLTSTGAGMPRSTWTSPVRPSIDFTTMSPMPARR